MFYQLKLISRNNETYFWFQSERENNILEWLSWISSLSCDLIMQPNLIMNLIRILQTIQSAHLPPKNCQKHIFWLNHCFYRFFHSPRRITIAFQILFQKRMTIWYLTVTLQSVFLTIFLLSYHFNCIKSIFLNFADEMDYDDIF